jgi:hypothetical protein
MSAKKPKANQKAEIRKNMCTGTTLCTDLVFPKDNFLYHRKE